MRCSSDVLKKTSPLDVFGDVSEKVKHLTNDASNDVSPPALPHSGRGEDFLTGQPDFFTETAVTPERKVEKSFPRWEINRHAEG